MLLLFLCWYFAAVVSSDPPFRLLRLLLYPRLFSACCGSRCSFLPPHAATAAAPSHLPPCFPHAADSSALFSLSAFSACCVSGCFLRFYYGSCSSLLRVLWRRFRKVLFCTSLRFCSFLLSGLSQASFVFHRFVTRASGSPSMYRVPTFLLGLLSFILHLCLLLVLGLVFFAPASIRPQLVYLALFCVSLLFSVMFLLRSDLRPPSCLWFPSRRDQPLGWVLLPLVLCRLPVSGSSGSGYFSSSFPWLSPFFGLFLGSFPRLGP